MNIDTPLIYALFGNKFFFFLAIFGLVFFVGREIACWYFKINDIKKLLEDIEENTRSNKSTHEPLEKSD